MANGRDESVLRLFQTLFNEGRVGAVSDEELLRRFAARGPDAAELAFSALLERHGPMVLRVCRAILRDEHDAQDAFQATFLVLARKAATLRVSRSLAPWLYGVALRTASCARSSRTLRRQRERIATELTARVVVEEAHDDPGPVLHEEIRRLPELYRGPILLCYFEGLTHEQAAERLDLPVGTVRSRLARARERLRSRLVRRGYSPDLAALGAPCARIRSLPEGLIDPALRAATRLAVRDAVDAGSVSASAAALTEGVLRTMLVTKWKIIAASLLAIGAITSGVGLHARQAPDPAPATAQPRSPATSAAGGPRAGSPDDYAAKLEELVRRVRREHAAGDLDGAIRDLKRIEARAGLWREALADLEGGRGRVVPDGHRSPAPDALSPAQEDPATRSSIRSSRTAGRTSHPDSQARSTGASEPGSTDSRLSELERKIDRLLLAFEKDRGAAAGPSPADPRAKPATPPPPGLEGRVQRVNIRNATVEISLGSDDGLVPGHELSLYRDDREKPSSAGTYAGRIRITATDPDQAVAIVLEEVGGERIKEGDRVSSRAPSSRRGPGVPATP